MSEELGPSVLDAAIVTDNPANQPEPAVAEIPRLWSADSIAGSLREAEQIRAECDRVIDRAEADIAKIDQRWPRATIDAQATEIRREAAVKVYGMLGGLVQVGREATAQQIHWSPEAVAMRQGQLATEGQWAAKVERVGAAELLTLARQAVGTENQILGAVLRGALNSRRDVPSDLRQEIAGILARLPAPAESVEATRKLQRLRYLAEMGAVELSARLRQRRPDPLDRMTVHRRYAPTV